MNGLRGFTQLMADDGKHPMPTFQAPRLMQILAMGKHLEVLRCEPFNHLGRQLAGTPFAGLGLVITRQLVEAMNGQLCVESQLGQGSCFTIALHGEPNPSEDTIDFSSSKADLRGSDAVLRDRNVNP